GGVQSLARFGLGLCQSILLEQVSRELRLNPWVARPLKSFTNRRFHLGGRAADRKDLHQAFPSRDMRWMSSDRPRRNRPSLFTVVPRQGALNAPPLPVRLQRWRHGSPYGFGPSIPV